MANENWVELGDLLHSVLKKSSHNGDKKTVGKIKHLILHLRKDSCDITAENEILQSEKDQFQKKLRRYKKLYEDAPAAYVTMDKSGVIRDVNNMGSKLIGLEKSQMIGSYFSRFVTVHFRRTFREHLHRLSSNGGRDKAVINLITIDNDMIEVLINSQIDTEDGDPVIFSVISDLWIVKAEEVG